VTPTKEKTMRQMSHALETMVAKAALEAHYQEAVLVDTAELERALKGALGELHRNRPRIVEFAPRVALHRVLALPSIRDLLTRPEPQPAPIPMRRLYQAIAR
jgi:hypothetical protein